MINPEYMKMWHDIDDEIVFADGFDDAFLGFASVSGVYVTVYDADKCIEILETQHGMEHEEAVDYFNFNVLSATIGERTPVFLYVAHTEGSILH